MPTFMKHLGFFYMPQIYDTGGEGRRAGDFFVLKNPTASAGFEPANLGTRGQHASSRPPKPLLIDVYISHLFKSMMWCKLSDRQTVTYILPSFFCSIPALI
jgi:hypothetical protein